jgi:hypothetical protein
MPKPIRKGPVKPRGKPRRDENQQQYNEDLAAAPRPAAIGVAEPASPNVPKTDGVPFDIENEHPVASPADPRQDRAEGDRSDNGADGGSDQRPASTTNSRDGNRRDNGESRENDRRDGNRDGGGQRPPPQKPSAPGKTINISQLQALSMADLTQMAKEMGIENFGTMRKHEVIFQILQKNAERNGILFSEGVLEILPEGLWISAVAGL